MQESSNRISRRQALNQILLLVGGSAALAGSNPIPAQDRSSPGSLSPDQLAMLEKVADLIIPETDSPGALAAGVPAFISQVLTEWASPQTRRSFRTTLDQIRQQFVRNFGPAFMEGPKRKQLNLLKFLDQQAYAPHSRDGGFRRLKSLVIFSFYTSEQGASRELRYDRVPGSYSGCLELASDDRAWSKNNSNEFRS